MENQDQEPFDFSDTRKELNALVKSRPEDTRLKRLVEKFSNESHDLEVSFKRADLLLKHISQHIEETNENTGN